MVTLASATHFHDIANHNGLITIKLKTVKIRTGFHRIIYNLDLNEIKSNIQYIGNLSINLNVTDHLIDTFHYKLKSAYRKIDRILPRRSKRGLINALGKVVKFVAGNPDNDDLEIINKNFETIESKTNNLIANQAQQIKINRLLEITTNRVTNALMKIEEKLRLDTTTFKKDIELINLMFNLDIIIKTLENIEDQLTFSKLNIVNKDILTVKDKEDILQFLKQQDIKITYEDEMFEFIKSISIIKNNIVIFIIKIPIVEHDDYDLLQLESTDINGSSIATEIQYVAKSKTAIYKQAQQCTICDNFSKLSDGCIYSILTNQDAQCPMVKQKHQTVFKEIHPGMIFVNSNKGVFLTDSCGDSRILTTPTIIETGNCTVTILNQTFSDSLSRAKVIEISTPIFGKKLTITRNETTLEDINEIHLNNILQLESIKLRLSFTEALGYVFLVIIMVFFLSTFCIYRFKHRHRGQINIKGQNNIKETITPTTGSSTNNKINLHPLPRFLHEEKKSTEDA